MTEEKAKYRGPVRIVCGNVPLFGEAKYALLKDELRVAGTHAGRVQRALADQQICVQKEMWSGQSFLGLDFWSCVVKWRWQTNHVRDFGPTLESSLYR